MKNESLRKASKTWSLIVTAYLIAVLFIASLNVENTKSSSDKKSVNNLNSNSMYVLGYANNMKSEVKYLVEDDISNPQVQVPVDLKVVKREQSSVDEGHSPWKLDPIFVAQVFVSLKISPEGIQGDYPIKYEELKIIKSNEKDAVVEVGGINTPIKTVYLKRLIKQDNTGIWTVVGYNPVKLK
jgi:hypothetical protein